MEIVFKVRESFISVHVKIFFFILLTMLTDDVGADSKNNIVLTGITLRTT